MQRDAVPYSELEETKSLPVLKLKIDWNDDFGESRCVLFMKFT